MGTGFEGLFLMEQATRGLKGGNGQWVDGVDPGWMLGFQLRPESGLLIGNSEKAFFLWETDLSFVVSSQHFIHSYWAGNNTKRSEEWPARGNLAFTWLD